MVSVMSGDEIESSGEGTHLTSLSEYQLDCLHLQLYRDSKDRYKQGQTKASLSLQHFLAVESGFTLDKESNTIAIICQDVTVVLAFDTRERLIQWQVKIANNLGEDQQFLIQISSAPARTKIATGPARLHVQEHRFCLAQGVPPRLIGFWQISQLRKYGVVENRFCFEGGSRCGRGEGVYVLVTDQGEEICRVLTLAAEGKLTSRRTSRSASRNASVCESPRKQRVAAESRFLTTDFCNGGGGGVEDAGGGGSGLCGCPSCRQSAAAGAGESSVDTVWPSAETSCCDYGDTTSVAEFNDKPDGGRGGPWGFSGGHQERSLERCMSCISKLGAMSRSSTGCTTAANTPSAANFTPAWTMEPNAMNCQQNLQEIASTNCGSTLTSDDYSVPNPVCDESRIPSTCQFCPMPLGAPPSRPPKPSQLGVGAGCGGGGVGAGDTSSPLKKKQKKPPMPLPTPQQPPTAINPHHHHHHHHHHCAESSQSLPHPHNHHHDQHHQSNAFENYDFPKHHLGGLNKDELDIDDYYDTPKNIKESLDLSSMEQNYGNYDTPPHPATAALPLHACNRNVLDNDARRAVVCPCHRMFGWAENWMFLPYCRRGNGIENTSLPFHKVKLDGEGRMPVVNKSGEVAIYATVNKLKKKTPTSCKTQDDRHKAPPPPDTRTTGGGDPLRQADDVQVVNDCSSNYVNVETSVAANAINNNYANLEFAQSLEYYENVRDLAKRPPPPGGSTVCDQQQYLTDRSGCKFCLKCGHPCKVGADNSKTGQDDYLMMEPAKNDVDKKLEACSVNNSENDCKSKHFPGYLPMLPISHGSSNPSYQVKTNLTSVEKAASVPSLLSMTTGRCRRQNDLEMTPRIPGAAMMGGLSQCHSATSSPYLRRNLMSSSVEEGEETFSRFVRKRSSSADSTRYIDNNLESITERTMSSSSSTQVNNSRNTSVDSLSSQIGGVVGEERDVSTPVNVEEGVAEKVEEEEEEEVDEGSMKSDSLRTLVQECFPQVTPTFAPVHIRRSSSIPCKSSSGHNRDSSSSNDSGVSIASLRHRGADFAEFELPLTTSKSSRRHFAAVGGNGRGLQLHQLLGGNCLHASLPRRRSKSASDPLHELHFQFQRSSVAGAAAGTAAALLPAKSSSAEAEVPVYSLKRDLLRGCVSPAGDIVLAAAYLDSRSTSSGTSDMSDYFETLSLSSYSSSDTPDSLRLSRPAAATTLRPRSGKEYHKIDRCVLEVTAETAAAAAAATGAATTPKQKQPVFGPITTVPEKTETLPADRSK